MSSTPLCLNKRRGANCPYIFLYQEDNLDSACYGKYINAATNCHYLKRPSMRCRYGEILTNDRIRSGRRRGDSHHAAFGSRCFGCGS